MIKKDWSNLGFVAVLPFLCVAIIYATEAFSRYSFFECKNGNCSESIPAHIWKVFNADPTIGKSPTSEIETNEEGRQAIALRYSGRITWFFISEIFLYVCIGSLIIGTFLSFQVSPPPRILWVLGSIILSSLVGLFFHANPKLHMAIFLTLFENAITPDVPKIAQIVNSLNSMGNAALFSLLLARYSSGSACSASLTK